jgi:hypothetical protein
LREDELLKLMPVVGILEVQKGGDLEVSWVELASFILPFQGNLRRLGLTQSSLFLL